MQHQQSILPTYDVFADPPRQTMPRIGRPPKPGAQAGLGVVRPTLAMVSPVAAAAEAMSRRRQGVGQLGGVFGDFLVWAVVIGAGGWLSYQAGKAMAPAGKENMWGWVGVPAGLLTGTLGLGVMGFIANRKD